MFAKYFDAELEYLRRRGREFAARHQSAKHLLGSHANDPDVERLLEGFAFLTARIRERIEDESPALIHGLAEVLLPQLLRPIPSTSIVEYQPDIHSFRAPRLMRREDVAIALHSARSTNEHSTPCLFQTCFDVTLAPLRVEDANYNSSTREITISLETTPEARQYLAGKDGQLRFYIHGLDTSLPSTLMHWLTSGHCSSIALGSPGAFRELGPDALRVTDFVNTPLIPWPEFVPASLRLLQEYLIAPRRFFFFDIITEGGSYEARHLQLKIRFRTPFKLPGEVTAETFRLHCTPVVNCFTADTEPMRTSLTRAEQLIRVAGYSLDEFAIYDVEAANLSSQGQSTRRILPFYQFQNVPNERGDQAFYTLRRERSALDGGLDTFLSLAHQDAIKPIELDGDGVLHLQVKATNRFKPLDLGPDAVCRIESGPSVPVVPLTPMTRPVNPLADGTNSWRLLAHLTRPRVPLATKDGVKTFLTLNDLRSEDDERRAIFHHVLDAIREVSSHPKYKIISGGPARVCKFKVVLNETKLPEPYGQSWLLGTVLHSVFREQLPINLSSELELFLQSSEVSLRWAPQTGMMPLL